MLGKYASMYWVFLYRAQRYKMSQINKTLKNFKYEILFKYV